VNGDGRLDLVYNNGDVGPSFMVAALNKPNPANPKQAIFTPVTLPPRLGEYQTQTLPRQTDTDGRANGSQVWIQMIDMNADGRLDVVVANETLNAWVVYLNKPDQQDPNLVAWIRREIDIRPLLKYLPTSPAVIFQGPDGIFLPLSSTVTGHDQ